MTTAIILIFFDIFQTLVLFGKILYTPAQNE